MADAPSTQAGPPSDRIPLPELFRHATEYFGAGYRAAEVLEEKVFSRAIRTWVRWYSGSESAWMLYGKFGDFLGEETATPDLLQRLCQGMGFRRLLGDDGIYAGDNKTAFVEASRRDAAKFWPWPEDKQHTKGRRDPRGKKPAFDWEAALVEAAAYVMREGLPPTQADLENYIADWFGGDEPNITQVREHIGPLYQKLKLATRKRR